MVLGYMLFSNSGDRTYAGERGTTGGTPFIDRETKYVELTLRDVAGVKERVLHWDLQG
ncbi:MAG: hypothetical protein M1531_07535 [Chloroflexi bacterium]|nr:hypothetical protein [Chloroflexota bacterium]